MGTFYWAAKAVKIGGKSMQLFWAALVVLCFSAGLAPASAGDNIQTIPVSFQQMATLEGRITGYETVDYVFMAEAGQPMNVSLGTTNTATYFNILAPGENEAAFFNGSVNENQFEGVTPATGEFKIRVYMMRSAARRDESADYRLEIVLAPMPHDAEMAAPDPESDDALVEGTPYHATGTVPCAMGGGRPTGRCPFGVTREEDDSALVTITKVDGRTRVIFFDHGEAIGYDMSQADRGEFSAERQNDLSIIHIGEERYEIPDAVVTGD